MSQPHPILSPAALARALSVRDLTDPSKGPHAVQRALDGAIQALGRAWRCEVLVHRASPVVPAEDDGARLHDAGSERPGGRTARRASATHVLRTRTAAMMPGALRRLAAATPIDVLVACPGLVYRPAADRLHAAEGHEVDLWRLRRGRSLGLRDVAETIGLVAGAVVPGLTLSAVPAELPWASDARQVDVRVRGEWVRIGAVGLLSPALLAECGLPADASGLGLTLDLDRVVAIAKGVDDVRLLRSEDPRIAAQMIDLGPCVPAPADARAAPRCETLDEVRASIDDLDDRIVDLLAERRRYVLQAARFKRSAAEVRVPAREEQVVAHVTAAARRAGIEAELVERLYREMMAGFVDVERRHCPGGP
jgi:phenylalanyl-tRNA synthetase alpha chain